MCQSNLLIVCASKIPDDKVTAGHEAGADVPPVISPESKQRINHLIDSAEKEGAKILLDGRNVEVYQIMKNNQVILFIFKKHRYLDILMAILLAPLLSQT